MTEICSHAVYFAEKNREKTAREGKRIHFAYVMLKVRNKFILFLLALLPLMSEGNGKAEQILITLLLQTFIFLSAFIPALISRNRMLWDYDGRYISLSSGVLFTRRIVIPKNKICSARISKTIFLSLFKAVRLELRSSDGGNKPEITLYLSADEANNLVLKIIRPTAASCTLTPRTAPFLLMSASNANFAAGLSLLSAFIISFRTALNIPEKLYSGISETSAILLPYLSPAAVALTAVFFLGWLIHFIKICFSEARQVTTVSPESIITVCGLISTHMVCLRKNDISCTETRHTLLSSIFRQSSVSVAAVGLRKSSPQCVMSAINSHDCAGACSDLTFPHIGPCTEISVPDSARLIWWLPYLLSAVFLGILWVRLFFLNPIWFGGFSFFALIAAFLLLWKCFVGAIGSCKAKIAFSGQYVCVSSVRAFSFYSSRIFLGKIADFRITQSIFQRPRNLCTVYVRSAGSRKGLKCINLPYDTVCSLSERIL